MIEVGGPNWEATYYHDLSGEISITNDRGDEVFYQDHDGLKWQIEGVQEHINEIERQYKVDMKICKDVVKDLKKELADYKTKKYIVKEE